MNNIYSWKHFYDVWHFNFLPNYGANIQILTQQHLQQSNRNRGASGREPFWINTLNFKYQLLISFLYKKGYFRSFFNIHKKTFQEDDIYRCKSELYKPIFFHFQSVYLISNIYVWTKQMRPRKLKILLLILKEFRIKVGHNYRSSSLMNPV